MSVATIQRSERAHPPSAVHIFLPRNQVKCGMCYAKVCLSLGLAVRPSVTLISHALTVQDIEICLAPHDRGTFLKFLQTIFAIPNSGLAAVTIVLKTEALIPLRQRKLDQ